MFSESNGNHELINDYNSIINFFIYINPELVRIRKTGITNEIFRELVIKYKEKTNNKLDKNEFLKICYKLGKEKILNLIGMNEEEFLNTKVSINNLNTTINNYFFENNGFPTKEKLLSIANKNNKKSKLGNENMFASK